MPWPTKGSLNKYLDSRFIYRYIHILVIYIYILLCTKRESKHLFSLPFVGHGIPWIRSKIGPQLFSSLYYVPTLKKTLTNPPVESFVFERLKIIAMWLLEGPIPVKIVATVKTIVWNMNAQYTFIMCIQRSVINLVWKKLCSLYW